MVIRIQISNIFIVEGGDHHHHHKKKKGWRVKNEYVLFLFFLMCEEWGDKSQIAAIALSANYGMLSVIIGGILVSLFIIEAYH